MPSLVSRTREFFENAGAMGIFSFQVVRAAFRPPWELGEISRQITEIGSDSVPLILAWGVAVGIVMAQLVWSSLVPFGAVETVIPAQLSRIMFREMGPLMTGLLISARVGASTCAEVAVLRLTEQIDALESLAIDSFKHLVLPRVIGCVIALPILTTLMSFSEIAGGFFWEASYSRMTFRLYFDRIFDQVGWSDYLLPTLMTVASGFIIGAVSCFFGYTVKPNAAGVRRASMHSVVFGSLLVIIADVILLKVIALWFPENKG
jgi:ABC-type transport system involved in resistance to organic solvents, permease component